MNGTKICAGCGRELPLSEFNKNARNRDGLQDRCRDCFSAYNRKRYAADPDRFKASNKRRREGNPKGCLETRLKTCAKNPTIRNAYRAVEAAVMAGKIDKPDVCSGCGSKGRIEAHHHDYGRPLDVVWVCPKCHQLLDESLRVKMGEKPNGNSREVVMLHGGEIVCRFASISAAARAVGCSPSTISQCLAGSAKSAKGHQWAYAEGCS